MKKQKKESQKADALPCIRIEYCLGADLHGISNPERSLTQPERTAQITGAGWWCARCVQLYPLAKWHTLVDVSDVTHVPIAQDVGYVQSHTRSIRTLKIGLVDFHREVLVIKDEVWHFKQCIHRSTQYNNDADNGDGEKKDDSNKMWSFDTIPPLPPPVLPSVPLGSLFKCSLDHSSGVRRYTGDAYA